MMEQAYKVLAVDDEEMNLRLLSRLMSNERYLFFTAQNGRECLHRVEEISPDLILLDLMMPEMDGVEACRILKSDERTRHIPLVILTAYGDRGVKLKCLQAGANDFLEKPIDRAELQLRMHNLLEFKRHEDTRRESELLQRGKAALEEKNRELEAALSEVEKAHAQILQQEKMASIGQLAAGVAHEINNPVGYVMSNLVSLGKYCDRLASFIDWQSDMITDQGVRDQILQERRAKKLDFILEDSRNLIGESIEGTERIRKIVHDLKGFVRSSGEEVRLADINQGIQSALNVLWNELKYKVTVARELAELPSTRCNIGQLNQVFLNIIMNAAQAIEEQGLISIRTSLEQEGIRVQISDTGCGIAKEHIGRIFEPFFTTKAVGVGTGLGLSISYQIVKKHGGEIAIESEPGKGTTFTITIPVVE